MENETGQAPKLELVCCRCGHQGVYEVGQISLELNERQEAKLDYPAFGAYFRCTACQGPGPWEVVDSGPIVALLQAPRKEGRIPWITLGPKTMLQGVFIQTPALAEEALEKELALDPQNAKLHTALGGIARRAGNIPLADERYRRAVEFDPYAPEARLFLFLQSQRMAQPAETAEHVRQLIQAFLTGHAPTNPDLAADLALKVAAIVRGAGEELRQHLLDPAGETAGEGEGEAGSGRGPRDFVAWVGAQTGSQDRIVEEAARSLLRGEASPPDGFVPAPLREGDPQPVLDLIPELAAALAAAGTTPEPRVLLVNDHNGGIRIPDRSVIPVVDNGGLMDWRAPALSTLFRGSRVPPADEKALLITYEDHVDFLERHMCAFFTSVGPRTDQEVEEIFSALRRRPDGKGTGQLHDLLWQVAALLLATRIMSEAEFTALFGFMAHLVKSMARKPVSRNYAARWTQQD